MLLRILFFAILTSAVSSIAFGVNTIPNPTPKKGNFFQRLEQKILTKKVKKIADQLFKQKCDIVVLKNGDEIDVTVTQITTEEVRYKPCDAEGNATDHFDVNEVFMVKYANGERFVFEKNNLVQIVHYESDTRGGFAMGFLLAALLGLVGILIIALAFRGDRRRNALKGALTAIVLLAILLLVAILSVI